MFECRVQRSVHVKTKQGQAGQRCGPIDQHHFQQTGREGQAKKEKNRSRRGEFTVGTVFILNYSTSRRTGLTRRGTRDSAVGIMAYREKGSGWVAACTAGDGSR